LCRKTGLSFLRFFYDFDEFCNISVLIEKEKNERKEKKGLHRLGPAHNEAGPATRIQPRLNSLTFL